MNGAEVFRRNAHLSVPRFELLGLEKGKRIHGHHISDVLVDERGFVLVAEPERVLGRFLCMGGVMNVVAEDGRPHRMTLGEDGSYTMASIVQGGINVVVTDRRVAGVVLQGDSLWGRMTFDRVLLWDLDLRDIDDVWMKVKSGFLGTKEKPLSIVSHLPMMAIRLEVIAIAEVGVRDRKMKSCRPLMEVLVTAAASAQMASLAPESPKHASLDRVRSGEWTWYPKDKELIAELAGDDDMCLDTTGGRADRPHWSEVPAAAPETSTDEPW